jgi:hypothetical protein
MKTQEYRSHSLGPGFLISGSFRVSSCEFVDPLVRVNEHDPRNHTKHHENTIAIYKQEETFRITKLGLY